MYNIYLHADEDVGTVADLDSPSRKDLDAVEIPDINGDSEGLAAGHLDLALNSADGRGLRVGVGWERCA